MVGARPTFAPVFAITDLAPDEGVELLGADANELAGVSVTGVGDVNADGIGDLAIGAPTVFFEPGVGELYVVFGTSPGFPDSIELGLLDGTDGFVIPGIDPEGLRGATLPGSVTSTATASTISRWGFRMPMSRRGPRPVRCTSCWAPTWGFGASFDLSALDGANGFVIHGAEAGDRLGVAVAGAGDVKADGFSDIVVGADEAALGAGASCVVFGGASHPAVVEVSSLDVSTTFSYPPVRVGAVLTFQGVIIDPVSRRQKSVSTTNAVVVTIVP